MSSQAGYTLIETLMALTVVALAVTGLSNGLQVLLHWQSVVDGETARSETFRRAQVALDRTFNTGRAYRAQDLGTLIGDGQTLQVDCGAAAPCAYALAVSNGATVLSLTAGGAVSQWRLPSQGRTHFLYQGLLDSGEVWPPISGRHQPLSGVALVEETPGGSVTLLHTRVWAEEPAACAFDPVSQDCR